MRVWLSLNCGASEMASFCVDDPFWEESSGFRSQPENTNKAVIARQRTAQLLQSDFDAEVRTNGILWKTTLITVV